MPSLILWTFGIPLFGFILLYRKKEAIMKMNNLASLGKSDHFEVTKIKT
jgi:hypothetical protein